MLCTVTVDLDGVEIWIWIWIWMEMGMEMAMDMDIDVHTYLGRRMGQGERVAVGREKLEVFRRIHECRWKDI